MGEEVQFENSNDQEVAHAQSLQVPHGVARALTFEITLHVADGGTQVRKWRIAGWAKRSDSCKVVKR